MFELLSAYPHISACSDIVLRTGTKFSIKTHHGREIVSVVDHCEPWSGQP